MTLKGTTAFTNDVFVQLTNATAFTKDVFVQLTNTGIIYDNERNYSLHIGCFCPTCRENQDKTDKIMHFWISKNECPVGLIPKLTGFMSDDG